MVARRLTTLLILSLFLWVQGMLMLLMQNLQAHFAGQPLKTPVE